MITQSDRAAQRIKQAAKYTRDKKEWDEAINNLILNPETTDITHFRKYGNYSKMTEAKTYLLKIKTLAMELEVGKDYTTYEVEQILAKQGITVELVGAAINLVFLTNRSSDCKRYYILEKRIR